MHPVSTTNTHHDFTDFVDLRMVKNTQTWISWDRNIAFLWNEKILNLSIRWQILTIYCFVTEVIFKSLVKLLANCTCNHRIPRTNHIFYIRWNLKETPRWVELKTNVSTLCFQCTFSLPPENIRKPKMG